MRRMCWILKIFWLDCEIGDLNEDWEIPFSLANQVLRFQMIADWNEKVYGMEWKGWDLGF